MPWMDFQQGNDLTRRFFYKGQAGQSTATPLVIALHGGGGSATGFDNSADWQGIVSQYNVRVAIAEGIERPSGGCTWNVGDGQGHAEAEGIDDIAYLDTLIGMVGATGPVYLVGISKGAMLAYKYAHEGAHDVTGIGAVAGVLVDQSDTVLSGVKVVHMHGGADTNVPLAGGNGRGPVVPGLEESIDDNGPLYRAEVIVSDGRIDAYVDAGGNTWGVFYEVTNGPHDWNVSASVTERDFILRNLL